MAGASPPVPDDSNAAGLGGRGPVPLYLTIKDDYLVVRATRGGAAGAGVSPTESQTNQDLRR